MSIVIKTVNHREYAYSAYRLGKRVIHKYLGPASDPVVTDRVNALKERNSVPEKFASLFWDVKPEKLRLTEHRRYIIERVLEMGGLEAMEWLQKIYPTRLILDVCAESRRVSELSRNFWRFWFGGFGG